MVKQKKKRTKAYRGQDAKNAPAQVVRVQAVNRSKAGQWWFERKRFAKPIAITTGIVFVVVLLIGELIRFVLG